MSKLVVDASVVIKWVVPEDSSDRALALRRAHRLVAPDLLAAECANILWKKVRRGEVTPTQAEVAATLLAQSSIELLPMRHLMPVATELAILLAHPAYDCLYLSLAIAEQSTFVTADEKLARKLGQPRYREAWPRICALDDAADL